MSYKLYILCIEKIQNNQVQWVLFNSKQNHAIYLPIFLLFYKS